jgi:diguanylate cyclase (GGDEF)-like protein
MSMPTLLAASERYEALSRRLARLSVSRRALCAALVAAGVVSTAYLQGEATYDTLARLAAVEYGTHALFGVIALLGLVAVRAAAPARSLDKARSAELVLANEERSLFRTLRDPLTGLASRSMFLLRLRAFLSRADGRSWSVVLVDVDRFQDVNDRFGQAEGDRLLIEVGKRLSSAISGADCVARLNGDVFALLIAEADAGRPARTLARDVVAALARPFWMGSHELTISASAGVVEPGAAERDPADVLQHADAALRRARKAGRGQVGLFDPEQHEQRRTRLALEEELRRSIERGEIEAVYQPIISLVSGRIAGFEALARWRRGGELVSPDEFIPLAEESGLVSDLEVLVMRRAVRDLSDLQARFPLQKPLGMNLNLSIRHLNDPRLFSHMKQILRAARVAPGSLTLEVTESLLLDDEAATQKLLMGLRRLGFQLAIDDFGTGYSSLRYLDRLPLDLVKLDASFIRGMDTVPGRAAVAEAVATLAKRLSLEVVAEGVETSGQVARLRSLGYDKVQGYFFSKPVDARAAAQAVASEIQAFDASLAPVGAGTRLN